MLVLILSTQGFQPSMSMYTPLKSKIWLFHHKGYPAMLAFGIDLRYDVPMQDLLHVVKSWGTIWNKFLLLTDPKNITRENCYEYSARWEITFFMWENCPKFKECVTKSGVARPSWQTRSIRGCHTIFHLQLPFLLQDGLQRNGPVSGSYLLNLYII